MPRLPLAEKAGLWEKVGYVPSPDQQKAHISQTQHVIVIGGERGGKSFSAALEGLPHGLLLPFKAGMRRGREIYRPRLYWLVGPEFDDCRPEFKFLYEAYMELEEELGQKLIKKVSFPDEGACMLELVTGTIFETRSAENPAKCMSGRGPQGIIYCEAGRLTRELWDRGLSRLAGSEEPGAPGWSWASGIIQDSLPWFLELFEEGEQPDNVHDLTSCQMPSWSNRVIFPGGRQDPKILNLERQLNDSDFKERIAAEIAPPSDIVFPEFEKSVHIKPWRFQEFMGTTDLRGKKTKWPVTLAIDPGYEPGAYAVLAIQEDGLMVRVLDEIYWQRKTVEQVVAEAMKRPWWGNVRYGVIDPFGGTQHQAAESQAEVWRRIGRIQIYTPTQRGLSILEGIRRYRSFLSRGEQKQSYITFDPKCQHAIREHRLYRREPSTEGRRLQVNPVDRDCHALKAIIYWLMAVKGPAGEKRPKTKRKFSYGSAA